MKNAVYVFEINPCDSQQLLPQVQKALEKRVELASRARFPGLWERTDKLNAMAKGRTRSRLRTRVMSIICLLLGIFLFVPGLMEPRKLLVPLLVGAGAIGAGLGGLWRSRKKKKAPFAEAAKKLLEEKSKLTKGQHRVVFSAESMTLAEETPDIPYSKLESVIETADTFLLTFDQRVLLLLKQDLTVGDTAGFRDFIGERANLQWAEESPKAMG